MKRRMNRHVQVLQPEMLQPAKTMGQQLGTGTSR